MTKPWTKLPWLMGFIAISGCTSVHVHSQDGTEISVIRNIGITHISSGLADTEKGSLIYSTRGLGLTISPRGGTLGWINETTAIIGDTSRCSLILWIENDHHLHELQRLLTLQKISPENLCTISPGGRK